LQTLSKNRAEGRASQKLLTALHFEKEAMSACASSFSVGKDDVRTRKSPQGLDELVSHRLCTPVNGAGHCAIAR
jgi:hypothetical protein